MKIDDLSEEIREVVDRLAGGNLVRGAPEKSEVAKGLHGAFTNACDLIEDAYVLARNGKSPRSLAITILAFEEFAKIVSLSETYGEFVTTKDQSIWKEYWKGFVRHRSKQEVTTKYGRFLRETSGVSEIGLSNATPWRLYLPDDVVAGLDTVKQRSFYMDSIASAFSAPKVNADHSKLFDYLYHYIEERLITNAPFHFNLFRNEEYVDSIENTAKSKSSRNSDAIETALSKRRNPYAPSPDDSTEAAYHQLGAILFFATSSIVPNYNRMGYPELRAFEKAHGRSKAKKVMDIWAERARERADFSRSEMSGHRYYSISKVLFGFEEGRDSFRSQASAAFKGIGRNDPCPCDSGKKFKRCCMPS